MWYIQNINRLHFTDACLLPTADFVLSDGNDRKKLNGWLPCHETNIGYELVLKGNRIVQIIRMKSDPKKKQKRNIITKTARRIGQKKFAPKHYTKERYLEQTKYAHESMALWTCAVVYTHWELRNMNIEKVFQELTHNVECIIQSKSIASRPRFFFEKDHAKILIQKILRQMGELPYDDWEGFEARWGWQKQLDTAAREKPSEHIPHLQKYQNLWTTTENIQEARELAKALRPNNVTLVVGSPCPSIITDKHAVILVRHLEDAYRWKCEVNWGNICMLKVPFDDERRTELGVADVQELDFNQTVYIPWAHLWSQTQWLAVANKHPTHITAIGRLDQWPAGKGQVFRDMLDSKKIDTSKCYHAAVDCVEMVETDNIQEFVKCQQQKHKVIQCFGNTTEKIDCQRVFLSKPYRTRTLRPVKDTDLPVTCQPLYEELRIHAPDAIKGNASVQDVRYYKGLKVPAGIYLCSENTTPFDIHVARTHCKDILYIVNCTTCLFAMQKRAPARITINPFIN